MANTHPLDLLSTRALAVQTKNHSFVDHFLYDQNGKELVNRIRFTMMDMMVQVVHNRGDLLRRVYDRMPVNIQSNPERYITAFHIAYNLEVGDSWDLDHPVARKNKFV